MKLKKTVLCFGAPGNGRDEIISRMMNKIHINYGHLFSYIIDEAKKDNINLKKDNILDFFDVNPKKLEIYRLNAINKIVDMAGRYEGISIVSTPYSFKWKGKKFFGLTKDEIIKINPDLIIIIIDNVIRIHHRLENDPQWKINKFSLNEIIRWRREEILSIYNLVNEIESNMKVYLVPYDSGSDFLKEIIMDDKKKKIYLSHPITGEGIEFYNGIKKFVKKISDYYIVFDPYMIQDWNMVEQWNRYSKNNNDTSNGLNIKLENTNGSTIIKNYSSFEIKAAIKNIRFSIVDIDYKLIESSDAIIVYHPRKEMSAGVMAEMVESKKLGKIVYSYYPYYPEPHFEMYSTHSFNDEKDFLNFIIKESKILA